jgi:hypothetical protein
MISYPTLHDNFCNSSYPSGKPLLLSVNLPYLILYLINRRQQIGEELYLRLLEDIETLDSVVSPPDADRISVSTSLSLSLSLSRTFSLSLSLSFFLSRSLSLSLSPYLFATFSPFLSVTLSIPYVRLLRYPMICSALRPDVL